MSLQVCARRVLLATRRNITTRSVKDSFPTQRFCRRRFSDQPQLSAPPGAATGTTESTSSSIAEVTRHGSGDGVITLNVGGTEFITLRSTIQMNPVLLRHVGNAEANQEFTNGGSVFIDRDPACFGLILQHLRNRADVIGTQTSAAKQVLKATLMPRKKISKNQVLIQIPKDQAKARDLFVGARYFQIQELEDLLCSYDMYTRFSTWVGGGNGNPFHAATELVKNARRALLATSGLGVVMGAQSEDFVKNVQGLFADVRAAVLGTPRHGPKSSTRAEVSFS